MIPLVDMRGKKHLIRKEDIRSAQEGVFSEEEVEGEVKEMPCYDITVGQPSAATERKRIKISPDMYTQLEEYMTADWLKYWTKRMKEFSDALEKDDNELDGSGQSPYLKRMQGHSNATMTYTDSCGTSHTMMDTPSALHGLSGGSGYETKPEDKEGDE